MNLSQTITRTVILVFVALTAHFKVSAQAVPVATSEEDLTPKYVNEFLNIGVGARALGINPPPDGGGQVPGRSDSHLEPRRRHPAVHA